MSRRLAYIDGLKGFAILLVIVGHLIRFVYCPNNFSGNIVFRYIYSFHMAFFMAISGFTVKTNYQSFNDVLKSVGKRFQNLLLPFICWALFSHIFLSGANIWQVFSRTDLGLWFLHALFFIYCIFALFIYPVRNKNRIWRYGGIVTAYCAILIIARIIKKLGVELDIFWIVYHFPNFCIGYILADNKNSLLKSENRKYIPLTILIFILLGCFWQQSCSNRIIEYILNSYLYRMILSISIILSLFWLAEKYQTHITTLKLNRLGYTTLGIYAVHQPLIKTATHLPNALYTCFSETVGGFLLFFIILISSLVIVKLLSKFKITSLLFLGRPN